MKKLLLTLLLLLIISLPVAAAPFDPTNAYGVMPNANNPAIRDVPVFVLNTGVDLHSNSLSYKLLPLLNADWNAAEREWVAALVEKNGLKISGVALPSVRLNMGIFGLHAAGKAAGTLAIPKHFTDLIFLGHDAEELMEKKNITYSFEDLNGHGAAYAEAGATFAHTTQDDFTVALTAKALYGFGYGNAYGSGSIITSHTEESTAIIGEDLELTTFHSLKGIGYAFDLGARYQVNSILSFDASLLNIGQIQWTGGESNRWYREGEFTLVDFGFSTDDFNFFFETGDFEEPVEEEKETGLVYTWKLPRVARVGADLMVNRSLSVSGEVSHTTYFQPQGQTSSLEVAGGMEYRLLRILPLRITAQKAIDEKAVVNGGLGLNLGFLRVDASVTNILAIFMKDSRGFGLGLSTTLKF